MNNIQRFVHFSKLVSNRCFLHGAIFRGAFSCQNVIEKRLKSTSSVQTATSSDNFVIRLFNKIPFLSVNKSRLKVTGYLLYESIVDNINYAEMFSKLNLPDTFYSWFVITELHIWMLMVRCMVEGDEGRLVRNNMVEALWADCKHRTKKLGAANPSGVRMQMVELSEQLNAALVAYDEGLQSSDTVLAGALWRRFYQQQSVDPEHLDALVKYIRKQIKILDCLTFRELFIERQVKWEPFIIKL